MLSIFPELLNFSLLGVAIIRVVVGLSVLYIGIEVLFKKSQITAYLQERNIFLSEIAPVAIGILSILTGVLIFIGLFTQVSVIVAAYLLLNLLVMEKVGKILNHGALFYILIIIISLSMILIGPGLFAFDLPL